MTETVGDASGVDSDVIQVRRATVYDLAIVVSLRIALLREYANHPVYGRLRKNAVERAGPLFEQQLRAPDQAVFLASIDDATAGIIRCVDIKGSPLLFPDRYCYITSAYVRPAQRRRGVLTALLRHAEEWARARGLTEMRLHNSVLNDAARGTWDRLGFVINEEVRLKSIEA